MRVTPVAPRLRVAATPSGAAAGAAFEAALATGGAARGCGTRGVAGHGLLGLQEDPPPRRRRPLLETADACLEGLRRLQRDLLDAGGADAAALEAAAEEAEAHAAAADEDGRRICLGLALRLRLELAKRRSGPPDGAATAPPAGTFSSPVHNNHP